MKILFFSSIILSFILFFSSCTVTNNFYVNNAIPVEVGKLEYYGGISTGYQPKLDSTRYRISNNLSGGIQTSLCKLEKTNIRAAIHFPEIIGGFGARLGIQQSFFKRNSDFNIAIGTDLGFTAAKDSVKNFVNGEYIKIQNDIKGAYNFDFFLPMTFRIEKNTQITLTPRYSYTFISLKKSKSTKLFYPAMSAGFKYKYLYFETTATYINDNFVPFFGLGFILTDSKN